MTAGISGGDKTNVESKLKAGIDSGKDGKATISFDKSENEIKVVYDNLTDNSLDFTATYDFIS